MQKPLQVVENETQRMTWDFDIEAEHSIPIRRQNLE